MASALDDGAIANIVVAKGPLGNRTEIREALVR
jgi:hypothetical protein